MILKKSTISLVKNCVDQNITKEITFINFKLYFKMLDFISHQNFELVQLGILSMSIAYDIKKKDSYGSIFSNSLIYKTIIALLTICVIILSFELKWWIAILYLIFSFIIHAFIAGLLMLC